MDRVELFDVEYYCDLKLVPFESLGVMDDESGDDDRDELISR